MGEDEGLQLRLRIALTVERYVRVPAHHFAGQKDTFSRLNSQPRESFG